MKNILIVTTTPITISLGIIAVSAIMIPVITSDFIKSIKGSV